MNKNTRVQIDEILSEIELINNMIKLGYNKDNLSRRYNMLYNELSVLLNKYKLSLIHQHQYSIKKE